MRADAGVGVDALLGSVVSCADLSGNGNDVSSSNGPSLVSDSINGYPAFEFDGSQSLVGTTNDDFKPENITVVCVYKMTDTGSTPRIICQPYGSSWTSPYLAWGLSSGYGSNSAPFFNIYNGTSLNYTYSGVSSLDSYKMIASTYDGSLSKIYINGELLAYDNVTGAITYGDSDEFYIGASPNGQQFEGDIVEIMIFNRSLSAEELEDIGNYLNDRYEFTDSEDFERYSDDNSDGILDNVGRNLGIDPTDMDDDDDGISNADELAAGTDPLNADTDNDGVDDGEDAYPLDPTRSALPEADSSDTTGPTVTLITPADATMD